jgi:hypothetical protein
MAGSLLLGEYIAKSGKRCFSTIQLSSETFSTDLPGDTDGRQTMLRDKGVFVILIKKYKGG